MGAIEQKALLDPNSAEGMKVINDLHPDPPAEYSPPEAVPNNNWAPVPHITIDEVDGTIKRLGISKAPGPSGLGNYVYLLNAADEASEALAELGAVRICFLRVPLGGVLVKT